MVVAPGSGRVRRLCTAFGARSMTAPAVLHRLRLRSRPRSTSAATEPRRPCSWRRPVGAGANRRRDQPRGLYGCEPRGVRDDPPRAKDYGARTRPAAASTRRLFLPAWSTRGPLPCPDRRGSISLRRRGAGRPRMGFRRMGERRQPDRSASSVCGYSLATACDRGSSRPFLGGGAKLKPHATLSALHRLRSAFDNRVNHVQGRAQQALPHLDRTNAHAVNVLLDKAAGGRLSTGQFSS